MKALHLCEFVVVCNGIRKGSGCFRTDLDEIRPEILYMKKLLTRPVKLCRLG